MSELPARIRRLDVDIAGRRSGTLTRESQYVFAYAGDDPTQPSLALLMPPTRLLYQDGELFAALEMNLPEGFLFQRIVELHPKQPLTKMHLLALMGTNGIGRVGYRLQEAHAPAAARAISKAQILSSRADGDFFEALVNAYLSTGAGIAGVQPKIMVPSRATLPIPDLIVKSAGEDYPDLAANEFLCLSAAQRAGLAVPRFDLSADGRILVLERFDLDEQGGRLGFEDIAALMDLRVHDRLSQRKYQGSYEAVAEVIRLVSSDASHDLQAFYEQLALSVMVRNGDAHLKNFGLIYHDATDVRLSPLFDVVTTSIYRIERPGLPDYQDRTLALKWRRGQRHASRAYPDTRMLLEFGRQVCGVNAPQRVIERLADAMADTLREEGRDERVPQGLVEAMATEWQFGMAHAAELRR